MSDILIMNFSNIYNDEDFYKGKNYKWINCSEIRGTNCYCNDNAEKKIENIISSYSPKGIHFIDSGNYHYVSKMWLDKIERPFVLILFDNHSDMIEDLFTNMLSCGNWLKKVINENKQLKKIILFGPKKIPEDIDKNKIIVINKDDMDLNKKWTSIKKLEEEYPIYISIDKDVMDRKYVLTSWSQGKMQIKDMEKIIDKLLYKHEIIGIDICGEYNNYDNEYYYANIKNNKTNKELLDFIIKDLKNKHNYSS